jgi:hypothetical protein
MKKCYILESRRGKSKAYLFPNVTDNIIGVFSKPRKAVKWIEENGETYFHNQKMKKRHFLYYVKLG